MTAGGNAGGVELAVSDNGPGMAADQLDHIFDRFTRGDAGLTQHVGGTGLGLAISKSLVELHGGTISAESVQGQGSTFRVSLPALRQRTESREPTTRTGPRPNPARRRCEHASTNRR